MVAAVSVTCGNVDDGTGDIRAKIDAVHIRVDGAPVYNADGTQKRYRLRIVPQTAENENDVSSGYSHLFAPDANGDHQWDGYIFPAADTYDVLLEDEEQAASDALGVTGYTVANPTVITTDAPHGLQTGEEVTISGTTGGTPDIDGTYAVTVISDTTFSIPVNVSNNSGTGSSVQSAGVIDRTEVEVI
jgi:hypothetical protein